jgi:squalene-associated FAD-dependent desaturase
VERSGLARTVAIVGGGLAGLAAAQRLAQAGARAILFESRRQLGGRASSFLDPSTGELVDNCQHVSMGCCTNLARFCQQAGISDQIETHPTLFFQDEQGRVSSMKGSPLPAPLHLAPSFLFARFLTWVEKCRVAYGMIALLSPSADRPGASFLDWLRDHYQTERTIDRFWGVVLTSALNETIDRIDLRYARQVFVEGFLSNRKSMGVEIPRTPLSEFYGPVLADSLRAAGVEVRLQANVGSVAVVDGRATGVHLRSGEFVPADVVILAVAPHHAGTLVPADLRDQDRRFEQLDRLDSSPITSVHLWYDRPVMDWPHLVGVGRQVQWLFRRPSEQGGYVQAVISASRELSARGADEVLRTVRQDVEEMLPTARSATLRHHRVVTERRATFSVQPGVDAHRPATREGSSGLLLAGDYVQTGWPATMEGAVRSGYLAAQSALDLDPVDGLAPPLPAEPLVRWLARLVSWGNAGRT